MQDGNQIPMNASLPQNDCAFCQYEKITDVLKETEHFLLAADHAPLVGGHLLIIPKQHYACYGDVPTSLDNELFAFKDELRLFYKQYYSPVVFWEHGVFRQTVFHAHLHCFPWGNIEYDLASNLHTEVVTSQEDIRRWYHTRGHYFYLEDESIALLFEPEMDRYMHVVQRVFQRGLANRGGPRLPRSPQERYDAGRPLIESVTAHWRSFQRQEVAEG